VENKLNKIKSLKMNGFDCNGSIIYQVKPEINLISQEVYSDEADNQEFHVFL